MNADELLDFALGQLEDPRRRALDEASRSDPEVAAKIQRARRAVDLLCDDGLLADPPPGLAGRTLAFVAQSPARSPSILDYVPARVPFRWADFAVAASIFVAGLLTLMPAVQRSRERMNQAGCVFNLQQIGQALGQYATIHPSYPSPPSDRAGADSGLFAAFLRGSGVLPDVSVLDCPYNGRCDLEHARNLTSFEQADAMSKSDPAAYKKMVCWDYGYNPGYRHASGRLGPITARPASLIAVVADQPPDDASLGDVDRNSPNHFGAGQNVLYSDGGVRWHRSRLVAPDDRDVYLNNARKMEPGINDRDSVILPRHAPFGNFPGR
ncbi:hypothetical protein [Paludisphaera mucosa]|uniref:DUF1559 domain-containing protein n=1 Tax=Paludisphaera mucosa TaxID=3030827 RepID=A0ABT6F5L8_9BACT|nr:hypothetical protein [Paludisphaera mucosa]MDG3002872.1 hypothetical protein [Paludisphaera mucosa]